MPAAAPASHTVVPLVALAVAMAACTSADPAATATSTVTDSAGVALVTGPATDMPYPITLTEAFRLGGADSGAGSFSGVDPRLVGTDDAGRIYVLDRQQSRVEVFDRTGQPLAMLGRSGGGPGEIQDPAHLLVLPDGEVNVVDYAKRAIVRWSAEREVLPEIATDFFPSEPIWRRGDTLVYVHEDYGETGVASDVRIQSPRDTLPLRSMRQATSGMIMFGCVGLNVPPMFSPRLLWQGTADRLVITAQVPYVIDAFERGRLVRSIRRPIATEAPTLAHVERLHPNGMKVGFGGGRSCTIPTSELFEKQGVAELVPLVENLRFDPAGRLWVQRFGMRDEPRSVDVFDAEGQYLGTLAGRSLPLGFIGTDTVLFADRDDDTGLVQRVAYPPAPAPSSI